MSDRPWIMKGDAVVEALLERNIANSFRRALAPPERLTIAEWAERYLRLSPKVTNYAGSYRVDLTPYAKGVFEAYQDPSIEIIILCFAGQTAKTTIMLVCKLSRIDLDPGPALWAMPTETLARSFSQNRLQPLIDETPRLASEKPSDPDRYKTLEMQLKRMTLALVGGNSPSNLASRPIRYLFVDEVDKFPVETTREGSALNLAIRRTAAFWNRKIMIGSTPSLVGGQIWQGLMSGDWREYWVPCPRCGGMQVMRFEQIRKTETMKTVKEIEEGAWYECPFCQAHIEHHEKPAMLQNGEWRPRCEPVTEFDWTPPAPGGKVASFWLPSWYSPWVRWSEVLARFAAAAPYPEALREVINQDLAWPWLTLGHAKREEEILAHRLDYPEGTLPSDARPIALIVTADVQKDHLYYVARAWGPMEESWMLAYGVLMDFDALELVIHREYGGRSPHLVLIDCGFRTAEVYDFCRRSPGRVAVKGADRQFQPVRWSTIDRYPDQTVIPGGVKMLLLDASHFREMLFRKLSVKPGDPGAWHLHADTHTDYARQLTAEVLEERKDARGRIKREWKQIRPDNHYFDLEVYQLAAANALGLRFETAPAGDGETLRPKTDETRLEGSAQPQKRDAWAPTRFKV